MLGFVVFILDSDVKEINFSVTIEDFRLKVGTVGEVLITGLIYFVLLNVVDGAFEVCVAVCVAYVDVFGFDKVNKSFGVIEIVFVVVDEGCNFVS